MIEAKVKFDLRSKRQLLIFFVSFVAFIVIFLMEPIAQEQTYHEFADQRYLFLTPNFLNVISNLPFLFVGTIGLILLIRNNAAGLLPELKSVYMSFFIGLIIIGIGSAYYHLNPSNNTLVWDRLPMTLSFMAFFIVIIGENVSTVLAKRILFPALLLGVLSVFYWILTESNGEGDLRPYILVQFLPMIIIPLILWLFPSPFIGQRYILFVLLAYVLAKIMEFVDHEIYQLLGFVSGHTIKHVIAALGTYFFYLALKKRRLRNL